MDSVRLYQIANKKGVHTGCIRAKAGLFWDSAGIQRISVGCQNHGP